MSTFLRVKLSQVANLVKTGDILGYFEDGLKSIHGATVDPGFYGVNEISVRRSYNNADSKSPHLYTIQLIPVNWRGPEDISGEGWHHPRNPNCPYPQTVQMRKEGLFEHFSINYPGNRVAAKSYVTELIKDQFKKVGRIDDFDETVDYDKLFNGMTNKLTRKNPFQVNEDDKIDMMHNAILAVINEKTIKKYDPKKSILKYFGGMFRNRMIDQLRAYTTRKVREVELQNKDFTQEETREYLRNKNKTREQESPEDVIEFKQLEKGLLKFLMVQRDGDWQRKLWVGLMKGMSNKDIAKKLGVSPAFITKKLKNLQKYIMEYAKKTNNNLLADLVNQMGGRRRSKEDTAGDDAENLFNLFKEYKEVTGSKGYTPIGDISKIIKKTFTDHGSDEYVTQRVLDSGQTTESFQAELDGFFDELETMDDLVEEDSNIIGLKILETIQPQ